MGKSFFLAPLGCIYYPIEILPDWLQYLAKLLPLVHLFEEMRSILINDIINYYAVIKGCLISLIYFFIGVIVFYWSYGGAKLRGTLINMGSNCINISIKLKNLKVNLLL